MKRQSKPEAKQQALLILVGASGSGKSFFAERFAKRHNFVHINSDQVRSKLLPKPQFTDKERAWVYEQIHPIVIESLSEGKNVILDGNLLTNAVRRTALDQYRESVDATIMFVCFDIATKAAIRRALGRSDSDDGLYNAMPAERANRFHKIYEPLASDLPQVTVGGSDDFSQQEHLVLKAITA